jgi:hypothetical protein
VTINVIVKVLDIFGDTTNCGCGCDDCTCKGEPLLLTEENMGWIKKQWKKFIDWFFKDFY